MPAYALFDNVRVVDPDGLEEYRTRVKPLVERHGGRYVVVGGDMEIVEGDPGLTFPVLIEFPDLDAARAWYESEEYRPLLELRKRSVEGTAVFLEGLAS